MNLNYIMQELEHGVKLQYYYYDTTNYLKNNNPNAKKSVQELIYTFELGDVYRPGTNWT